MLENQWMDQWIDIMTCLTMQGKGLAKEGFNAFECYGLHHRIQDCDFLVKNRALDCVNTT